MQLLLNHYKFINEIEPLGFRHFFTPDASWNILRGNVYGFSRKNLQNHLFFFHNQSKYCQIDEAVTQEPIMTRCFRFKHNYNMALQVYEDPYKD